jgi:hypothetical protein
MQDARRIWLAAACTVAFLAVGVPYWLVPYNKLNLPDALLHPGLLLPMVAALALRAGAIVSFARAVHALALSVAAVVMARVLADCLRDPTAHNLWPFELVIALLVGYACSACGALVGAGVARALRLDPEGD